MKKFSICDNCRRRKQRCDRELPCQRCTELGVECTYNLKREYEKPLTVSKEQTKLAQLTSKIDEMEDFLRNLVLSSRGTPNYPSSSSGNGSPETESSIISTSGSLSIESMKLSKNLADFSIQEHLVELFFKYSYMVHPFIEADRIEKALNSSDRNDSALINAICGFSCQLSCYILFKPLINLNNNNFYSRCRSLLLKNVCSPSLEAVQALVLCQNIEMGYGDIYKATYSSAEAVRMSQCLNINHTFEDDFLSTTCPLKKEEIATWIMVLTIDRLSSLFFSKPSLIPFDEYLLPLLSDVSKDLFKLMTEPIESSKKVNLNIVATFGSSVQAMLKFFRLYSQIHVEPDSTEKLLSVYYGLVQLENNEWFVQDVSFISKEKHLFLKNPYILPRLHSSLMTLGVLMVFHFLLYQKLSLERTEDMLKAVNFHLRARELAFKIFNFHEELLKIFEFVDYDGGVHKHLYYLIHFASGLTLKWAQQPFALDSSKPSQSFVKACKDKLEELSCIWPMFKTISTSTPSTNNHNPFYPYMLNSNPN